MRRQHRSEANMITGVWMWIWAAVLMFTSIPAMMATIKSLCLDLIPVRCVSYWKPPSQGHFLICYGMVFGDELFFSVLGIFWGFLFPCFFAFCFSAFSPPARWGLLDLIIAVLPPPPPPPPPPPLPPPPVSPRPCLHQLPRPLPPCQLFANLFANFCAQYVGTAGPQLPASIWVGTAGPQPQGSERSGHRWTSTWGLPSAVGTAGPQPGAFRAQWAPLDLNLGPSELSGHRWTSTAR